MYSMLNYLFKKSPSENIPEGLKSSIGDDYLTTCNERVATDSPDLITI
jgi:hypothetical protein